MSGLIAECHKYEHLKESQGGPEDLRIDAHMDAGDELRRSAGRGDMVALLAVGKIRDIRSQHHGESEKPIPNYAYIFNSIKHPTEVRMLREIYGSAFFVVSAYSPRAKRLRRLSESIARSRKEYDASIYEDAAERLIVKDEKEFGDEFGQNVRDVFPLADVFINTMDGQDLQGQLSRFVNILFGHPYITPTVDENGMFHAKAAALRSADLSRQVGAVIATDHSEIIAAGCNEVPKAGGGAVWEGRDEDKEKDYRDFKIGHDSSARMKHEIISEIFENLKEAGWLAQNWSEKSLDELVSEALYSGSNPPLRSARVADIIEFGRMVNAEMSAITDAARRGLAVKNENLYCTTFPCHMCARHIVASGIKKVIYIEPYPKSMAKDLYKKSIRVDHDTDADEDAVDFEPFVGISPRRYMDFFEMPRKRKDNRGHVLDWDASKSSPRVKQFPTYTEIEAGYVEFLDQNKIKLGLVASDE